MVASRTHVCDLKTSRKLNNNQALCREIEDTREKSFLKIIIGLRFSIPLTIDSSYIEERKKNNIAFWASLSKICHAIRIIEKHIEIMTEWR